MNNRSGCVKTGMILPLVAGILGLIAVCAFFFFDYSSRQQREVRVYSAPPTVLVNEPVTGTSVSAGSYIAVSAMATGFSPIVSVELWVDGELKETQVSERAEGLSPFYAYFDLLAPSEGTHMLFVRAVNSKWVIGQSPLVTLLTEQKPAAPLLAITTREGESLEDIANAYATNSEILQALNPGLHLQPPAGTLINVPLVPEDEPPVSESPPAVVNAAIEIPNTPMLQIASDRSPQLPGVNPIGFLPDYTTSPPTAPTGLQVEVKNCKITMRWNDNSDAEIYFVYIVAPNAESYNNTAFPVPYAFLKGFPGKGPVWYEFQPPVGGVVSLWVASANADGVQPSNIVWAYIPYNTGCSAITATDLRITLHDITASGNLDEVYCYASFEDKPEVRVPLTDGDFIKLQGGKNQGSYLAEFSIPVPSDGAVDMTGKCLGWAGNSLSELGRFSARLTQEAWKGSYQTLQGSSYQIGITINPQTIWFLAQIGSTNPTLPVPYDLREEPPPNDPGTASYYPPAKLLQWKWDGDPKKADAFVIFLNGRPYDYLSPNSHEKVVQLPGECDQSVRWQVAVRAGGVLSNLSPPVQYDLPPCKVYLRVSFNSINLQRTDDGWPSGPGACDSLEAYFQISVRDVTRSFWGGNFFLPMDCGTKTFPDITGGPYKQLYAPEPNVITIPLAPGDDIGGIWIRARFWDHDDNPDDLFATFAEHPLGAYYPRSGEKWSSNQAWPCYALVTTGASITDEAKSTLSFTYSVYPNTCRDTPPAVGF